MKLISYTRTDIKKRKKKKKEIKKYIGWCKTAERKSEVSIFITKF